MPRDGLREDVTRHGRTLEVDHDHDRRRPMLVTYLSVDSLASGVGSSQVLAYVERLPSRGVDVELVSFEAGPPSPALADRLADASVRWRPLPFGRGGAAGGIGRVVRGAAAVRKAELVHARSDLAAASAMLARSPRWVWDCRGLFTDQRIMTGELHSDSAEHRVLRVVERLAARRSDAIVTITAAVQSILDERHGPGLRAKMELVTTCVDLERFPARPMPPGPIRLLLIGTINRIYDVPTMLEITRSLAKRRPTELVVAAPGSTPWDTELTGCQRRSAPSKEVPSLIADCHVGLAMWRNKPAEAQAGAMPTKIGEFLSVGRPVVVNSSLRDAAAIVRAERCGVVVDPEEPDAVERAVTEIEELLDDDETARRCRQAAERHFDLDAGVDRLVALYERVLSAT